MVIGMMKMLNAYTIRFKLCSLSIFRGVLTHSIPQAFFRLLLSLDDKPEEFLRCYGAFFSLLSERGCADRLAYAFTAAALYDENCFTRACAGGTQGNLSREVLRAAQNDCESILSASLLTGDDLLRSYPHYEELRDIADTLPRWQCGTPVAGFNGGDDLLQTLAHWYRENGCGIFARYNAFVWRDGAIRPVLHSDAIDLDDFTGYERQRSKVCENTLAFLDGKTCNNCLLYGDMGTGKSSTVKALANRYRTRGLRIVEIPKERLFEFPQLAEQLTRLPLKFIIYIDDLSFTRQDESYTALKAVLEGGLAARPDNALIYATSNRRHLVKERLSDRAMEVDDINTHDNMQETLSLSDRFGLAVCFTAPTKKEFLEIVLAAAHQKNITQLTDDELCAGAERFALSRGGRSPRCAKQYIESLFIK